MKKLLTFVTALLLAVSCCFGLVACGGGGGSGGGGGFNGEGIAGFEDDVDFGIDEYHAGSLTIRVQRTEAELDMIEKLVDAFEYKYPDIDVTIESVPMNEYYNKLKLDRKAEDTTAGTLSDLFWVSQDYIAEVISYGNVIQPLEKLDQLDDSFSVDALVDEAVECSSLKVNGKEHLYMIPRDYNEVVMYYNVDMFQAKSIALPHPTTPMTQAQFNTMVESLRAAYTTSECAQIVDVNAVWDSFDWPLLKSFGATVANSDGEITFNSQKTKDALLYWKDLYDNNIVPSSSGFAVLSAFGQERAPICFHSRSALGNILAGQDGGLGVKKLGVAPVPNFGGEYAVGGGASGFAIAQTAKNKTEAWAFLKFIVSEEGQEAMGESGSHVPSLESLLTKSTANWRNYSNAKLVNCNPDTFLVARNNNAYTTTRDFFDYMPAQVQKDILDCISKCFQEINNPNYSPSSLNAVISNQAIAMEDVLYEVLEG